MGVGGVGGVGVGGVGVGGVGVGGVSGKGDRREGGREGGRAWVSWRGEERVEILFEREGGWWVKGKGMGGRVGG